MAIMTKSYHGILKKYQLFSLFILNEVSLNLRWLKMTWKLTFYFIMTFFSLYINYFWSLIRYHTRPPLKKKKKWKKHQNKRHFTALIKCSNSFHTTRIQASEAAITGGIITWVWAQWEFTATWIILPPILHFYPLSTKWPWIKEGNYMSKHSKQV